MTCTESSGDPQLDIVVGACLLGLGLLCLLANFGIVDFGWLDPSFLSPIARPFL